MGSPYLGEIRLFGGMFAPLNWQLCDGSLLAIDQNDALYNLLGTTFGGDGQTTFGVPDLRGRVPVHVSPTYVQGLMAGTESVSLTSNTNGSHNHGLSATGQTATDISPGSSSLLGDQNGGIGEQIYVYSPPGAQTAMAPQSISPAGDSVAHENRQPFVALTYIICTAGIYPTPE